MRLGEAQSLWPRGGLRGWSPASAKFGATGTALRGARVPPRAVPSAGSVPLPLPGQDKGSLTRDGTAPHKWDWIETEPETERERREEEGPRELGEATGTRTDRRATPLRAGRGEREDPVQSPGKGRGSRAEGAPVPILVACGRCRQGKPAR